MGSIRGAQGCDLKGTFAAEGAADKIQLLWSSHWSMLPQLITVAAKDAEFKDFIWKRVDDEIWPADRFALVLRNARAKCPPSGVEFYRVAIKASMRNLGPERLSPNDSNGAR
jgi:hypothetical protein